MLQLDTTIPSANYTVTAFVGEVLISPGDYTLDRVLASFTGNVANLELSVYTAPKGLTALTDAQRVAGEVYADTAVVATGAAIPEINDTGDPVPFTINKQGTTDVARDSLYVYALGGDNPTSGAVTLHVEG